MEDSEHLEYERRLSAHFARNREPWAGLAARGVGRETLVWLAFEYAAPGEAAGRALVGDLREGTDYAVGLEREGPWARRRWRVVGETPPCYVTRDMLDDMLDEWTARMLRRGARRGGDVLGWRARVP